MTKFTKAYEDGFSAKRREITEMGFAAARDKFNVECPVGVKWAGSQSGLAYANGEMAALEYAVSKGIHRLEALTA